MREGQRGLAPIVAIGVVGLLIGVFWAFNARRLAKKQIPVVSKLSGQITKLGGPNILPPSARVRGTSGYDKEGLTAAKQYEDTIIGTPIGKSGGVVATTLKSGTPAYFIISPTNSRVAYAEIGEYKELPTSGDHIPLYTNLGYGVNVAVEGKITEGAYLVFDFSKGKVREELKKLSRYINYCDFSTEHFNPNICATLLHIPLDQTTNPKYLAASPKRVSGEHVTKERVVLTEPTYYVADDLLVVEITSNTIVIPQPITSELIHDLVSEALAGAIIRTELRDILRITGYQLNAKMLVNTFASTRETTFKSLVVDRYFEQLLENFVANLKGKSKEEREKMLAGIFDPESVLFYLQKDYADSLQRELIDWQLSATRNRPDWRILEYAALLRRAYNHKLKGSGSAMLAALTKQKDVLQSLRQEVIDTGPAERNLVYAMEIGLILTGKRSYVNKPFAHRLLRPVFAQSPPPSSYFPPVENDPDVDEAIAKAAKEVAQELRKCATVINTVLESSTNFSLETIELLLSQMSDPDLGLDDATLKRLWQKFEEELKKAIEKAQSDDQKGEVLKYCQRYKIQLSSTLQGLCELFETNLVYHLCYVDKLPPLSLKNFADQHGIEIKCRGPDEGPTPALEPLRP